MAISGVTGTLAHGEEIVITGSSFGAKSTPAPLIWDDCEGTDPGDLWTTVYPTDAGGNFDMGYYTPATLGQGVALPFARGTKYAAGCHRFLNTATGGNFVALGFGYQKNHALPTYLSYWFRADPNWVDSGEDQNFKLYHWNNDLTSGHFDSFAYWEASNGSFEGAGSGDPGCDLLNAGDNGMDYRCVSVNNGVGQTHSTNVNVGFGESLPNFSDGWHKYEHFMTWSSTDSGRVRILVDGVARYDSNGTTDDATGTDRSELIGNYARSRGTENYRYFKHLYVDRTYARVMLGNASTLTACTVIEPQIPSAWSTTEITATMNLGPFADDATAYLFVVDSNGTASTGFEVTLGDEGEPADPGARCWPGVRA